MLLPCHLKGSSLCRDGLFFCKGKKRKGVAIPWGSVTYGTPNKSTVSVFYGYICCIPLWGEEATYPMIQVGCLNLSSFSMQLCEASLHASVLQEHQSPRGSKSFLLGHLWSGCLAALSCSVCLFFSDMTCSQRSTAHSLQSRGGFLSSFLSQSKKGPSRPAQPSGASPTQQHAASLGKKEPANHQVILNWIHWKVLSSQGVSLQHSTSPSFCFHLEEKKSFSSLNMYTGCECTARTDDDVCWLVEPL